MSKPVLSMKVRRAVWVETEHPRDRVGKFIETFAEVRVWGGRLAKVLRNVGGGRFEVEDKDTQRHYIVHRNYLTVVARPDGSAPTDSRDAEPAAIQESAATPDALALDFTRDAPATDITVHGEQAGSLFDLLSERDPDLAELTRTAAQDYVDALDNVFPDDEADERAGLLGVLDDVEARYGDDPSIASAVATLRETSVAEPDAAPEGPTSADVDAAFDAAITESREAGNPMSTGVLEVAHQNWRNGDQASAERLVDLGTSTNTMPAGQHLRDLWTGNAKPVYDGRNEGGSDGPTGADRGTALPDVAADRLRVDQGQGDVLPDEGGRSDGPDRAGDGRGDGPGEPVRDVPRPGGPVQADPEGRGERGDPGSAAGRPGAADGDVADGGTGPGDGRVREGDAGLPGGAGLDAQRDDGLKPGGVVYWRNPDPDDFVTTRRGTFSHYGDEPGTAYIDVPTLSTRPRAADTQRQKVDVADLTPENPDAPSPAEREWRSRNDPDYVPPPPVTFTIDGDEFTVHTAVGADGEWEAAAYGPDDAPGDPAARGYGPTEDAAVADARAGLESEYAPVADQRVVTAPDGTPIDVDADLAAAYDGSMPQVSVEDANAEIAAMVADRSARDGEAAPDVVDPLADVPYTVQREPEAPVWGPLDNRPGSVTDTSGVTVSGRITTTGNGQPVDVTAEDGTLNRSVPPGFVAAVEPAPLPDLTEADFESVTEPDDVNYQPRSWDNLTPGDVFLWGEGEQRVFIGYSENSWNPGVRFADWQTPENYANPNDTSRDGFLPISDTLAPPVFPGDPETVEAYDPDAGPRPTDEGGAPVEGDRLQPSIDPSLAVAINAVTGQSFKPSGEENLTPAGAMAKLDANLAALRTLRTLQHEKRAATPDEQVTLSAWAGWGGLSGVFDFDKREFESRRQELLTLLNTSEWNEARRNTLNAHYTDPRVVSQVWAAVRSLGFTGGRVLEPGSGSGTFIGLAPEGAEMVGVELDSVTAALSKYLYPHATIRAESFAKTNIPNNAFDATVGNVPFGKFSLLDRVHNADDKSIHNHFIAKSINLTRPGGIVAVLSSRYTLDSMDKKAREQFYAQADLIGAVRLPNGSHQRASGTDVIEDVLIFRKRLDGEERGDATWLESKSRTLDGYTLNVNAYFDAHPENILGTLGGGKGQYGGEVKVKGDKDMPGLGAALTGIVADAREKGLTATQRDLAADPLPELLAANTTRYDGHIQANPDGTFTQAVRGALVPFEPKRAERAELVALLGIRDTLNSLLDAESRTAETTDEITALRVDLNRRYDAYISTYGPLARYKFTKGGARRRPSLGGFKEDPAAAQVLALETYDPTGDAEWPGGYRGTVKKADIFTERAVAPREIATTTDDPADALTLSMDRYGEVNLPAIAKMLNVSEPDAREALGRLVFEVPPMTDTEHDAAWKASENYQLGGDALEDINAVGDDFTTREARLVPAAEYLSGYTRKKLASARAAAEKDPRYKANVEALAEVIPRDLGPDEIVANLGAAWIDAQTVEDFINQELLRKSPYDRRGRAQVRHAGGSVWTVKGPKGDTLSSEVWGTQGSIKRDPNTGAPLYMADGYTYKRERNGRSASQIVESLLRQKSIKITLDGEQDLEATEAAQAKAEAINQRFQEWLWEDRERSKRMQVRYNNQFNGLTLRKYEATNRTFVGMSDDWAGKVHTHVKAAVERIVNEPTALLAHVVGAGKTAEMVMGSAELKRLGLVRKPAIVVPNHMLEQFTREYLEIYPQAKLLAAGTDDLVGDKRREFVARAAVGQWDAVILTQNAFESIPMSYEQQERYIDREMAAMRAMLENAKAQGGDDAASKKSVKDMEKAVLSAENALRKKLDKDKDSGVTFEQTGIDYLMVDEAHMYANLRVISNITDANTSGSDKATDLHMKIEYLRETNASGRVATFASGTPIRNTMQQAYVMQRFLRPDMLRDAGIDAFDQWAATFGERVDAMELKPEGKGFRQTSRFAKFRNVPELLRMFHTFTDVKLAEDLNLRTPPVIGGGTQNVVVPPSQALVDYVEHLGDRAEDIRGGGVDPSEDNMLKVSGDGRKAALSMALVTDANGDPYPHEPGKIEAAAQRIARVYEQNKDHVYYNKETDESGQVSLVPDPVPGSMQIVFMDLGTPKGVKNVDDDGKTINSITDNDADWNGYDALKNELVEKYNIPAEKIRYIHEARNDAEKAEMFAAARSGRIAVLVGSSEKMGVGTNMQRRAVALHHIDAPWRPSDVEQRDGRIIRQGNDNMDPGVEIFRYVTERSFDTYMWQTLERKAKFINQIMRGSLDVREVEDIGDQAFDYATVKAIGTGKPDLLDLARADTRIAKLQRLQRGHTAQQTNLRAEIETQTSTADRLERAVVEYDASLSRVVDTRGDLFEARVGDDTFKDRAEAGTALMERMDRLRQQFRYSYQESGKQPLGTMAGFTVLGEVLTDRWSNQRYVNVTLDGVPGSIGEFYANTKDNVAANAFPLKIEQRLRRLAEYRERADTEARTARTEIARMSERIGAPFRYQDELDALVPYAARLRMKIERDAARDEGQAIAFDPAIDTDQFDSPLVKGREAEVTNTVPEVLPERMTVKASALAEGDVVEYIRGEVTGNLSTGRVLSVQVAGSFVLVKILPDGGGEPITRAYELDEDATKITRLPTGNVKSLVVVNGNVIVESKRAAVFREAQHPRDSHGRFIETFSEVRIWGGGLGRVIAMAGGGRVTVERSDGSHVNVDAGNLTVIKTPDGVDVPDTDAGSAASAITGEKPTGGAPSGTVPAPDAKPENATARFRGADGSIAWLEATPGEDAPVGYLRPVGDDPSTTVRYENPDKWVEDVDSAQMEAEQVTRGVADNPAPGSAPADGDPASVPQMSDDELDAAWQAQNLDAATNPADDPFTPYQQALNDEHFRREGDRSRATAGAAAPAAAAPASGFEDSPSTPERDDVGIQRDGRLSADGETLAVPWGDNVAVYTRDTSRTGGLLSIARDFIDGGHFTGGKPEDKPTPERFVGNDRYVLSGTAATLADAEAGTITGLDSGTGDTPKKPSIGDRIRNAARRVFNPDESPVIGVYDWSVWTGDAADKARADLELAKIAHEKNLTGKPDATGAVDDPIDVNGDLDKAVQLLAEGKHIRLNRVDEAGTLLDKLATWAKDAEANGEKAKAIDLCQVSVPGTNLFCQESKGIPRAQMPQLSGAPMPGSPADSMPRNKRGRVDVTDLFRTRLAEMGVSIEDKSVPAASLKATQSELNGTAVGGMMGAMGAGTMKDARIFVTRDNYVIDGHHRWAAEVGLDTADNALGDKQMNVSMIDMEIGEALDFANAFAYEQGIAQVRFGQPAIADNLEPDPGATPNADGLASTPDPNAPEAPEAPEAGSVADDQAASTDNAAPAQADTPGAANPITGGAKVTANVETLVESMGKVQTGADDNTTLPNDLASQAAEYDEALASGDIQRKVAAHLALSRTLVEVNNALDTGGTEPERQAALGDYAGVAAIVDANVARIFPPANAGGTPPALDAPTIDDGTVADMMGNAGRTELTDGGSAAAYLVKGEDGKWRLTAERQALHDAITASILDGVGVSDNPTYNFFGGGPASGKGSITRMFPNLKDNTAYINADEIKAVIPEMGARVRAKDPAAAGFTHEESSYLAKSIQREGFARKVNVTLDGTGDSSEKSVKKKIAAARAAGYKVDAYYVSVPAEIAVQRSIDRALNGVGADRGRFVPETVLRHTHASVSTVFPKVMNEFDSMVLFDTNVPFGSAPNLIARKDPGIDAEIVSEGKWQEFLDKAAGVAGTGTAAH